jgi:hypothetical protein
MTRCVQCQTKTRRTASTNGQHYLCWPCGEAGWCFIQQDGQWCLARDLSWPLFLQDTAYLRGQVERLQAELDAHQKALDARRAEYFSQMTQWMDIRPLTKETT